MKFVPQLTLERITLAKIATILCDQDDIRNSLKKFSSAHDSKEWKTVEDGVIKKVKKFPIPESLKEKILGYIRPIGLQISKWMQYHSVGQSHVHLPLPAKFCWTPHGVMDCKKTAELLIKEGNLDITKCFELACIYCLEEDIPVLWSKLPKNYTQFHPFGDHNSEDFQNYMLHFWTSKMKGEHFCYISLFDFILKYNLELGLLSSVKYLFKTLPETKRKNLLEIYSARTGHIDMFLFLLSQINEKDQIEVIENTTCNMLEWFLHWPLQSLFLLVADYAWDFLSPVDFMLLLQTIVWKKKEGYKDYDYPALFRRFWEKSPKELKNDFINGLFIGDPTKFIQKAKIKGSEGLTRFYCKNFRFLFFLVKEENILKFMLQDVNPEEKMKLILSAGMRETCRTFIFSGRWDSLQYFVKECLYSDQEKEHFKQEFEKRNNLPNLFSHEDRRHKWEQLFDLSNDSVNEFGKRRGISEFESNSPKRFCN